ncbi:putative amidase [Plasmopara halstedii]
MVAAVVLLKNTLLLLGDREDLPPYMTLTQHLFGSLAYLPLCHPYVEPTQSGAEQGEASQSLLESSKKGVTPVQVVKALLAAAETKQQSEYPPNVFVEKHDDWIMAQAQASAECYARGEPLGVLDGVLVAIKDEVHIKDHRIGTSFLGYEEEPATKDDTPVARLRSAGAIIFLVRLICMMSVSRVTTSTMARGSAAAFAFASGLVPVPLALGLDGGGSIRIPSSVCGVAAHVGPIACSVCDAAIEHAIVSESDESFPLGMRQPSVDLHSFKDTSFLKGSHQDTTSFKCSRNPVDQDTYQLYMSLMPLRLRPNLLEIWISAMSVWVKCHRKHKTSWAIGRSFTAIDFLAAQCIKALALRQFQKKAFKAGKLSAAQLGNILRFSLYGNLIGVPSVAVSIGYDSRGIPMAIQFQTAHWQENLMLCLAHIYFLTLDDAANYASN